MTKTNALRLLDKSGVAYRLVEYQYDAEDLDVAKIATDNGLELAQIYKTLVCQGDKTGPLVAVVPGDAQLDLKALAQVSGNKKIALTPLATLTALTGYVRGGCSPIGMKKDFPVILDEDADYWDEILINAGARGILFAADPTALTKAFGFQRAAISEP
jgi:Cys-tRNA(Pro)/Cys-tRNA(Cys) deacylase